MIDPNTQPTILELSASIGVIEEIYFDIEHSEFFAMCLEKVAVLSLSGELIKVLQLPEFSKVIGQQRTPDDWQCLCHDDSGLINYTISADQTLEVKLIDLPLGESAKTAAWSPCGHYVAVCSEGTTLYVWNTNTGQMVMQKSINWGNEDSFIIPPTLSVTGWSKTGNEIITTAGEMISNNVLIWDFQTKQLLTVIN